MVENVLFGNSLGHPASSKEKTKEEGGHIALVYLTYAWGREVGDHEPTGHGGDIWYMLYVNLSEGRILDFMTERIK